MPSARIQYMAWSTSSRMRRTSSSSIAHHPLGELGDRGHGRCLGRVVERRHAGPLGARHLVVERDQAGDLEVVGTRELLDGGPVALVADLVGDQRHLLEAEVLR